MHSGFVQRRDGSEFANGERQVRGGAGRGTVLGSSRAMAGLECETRKSVTGMERDRPLDV